MKYRIEKNTPGNPAVRTAELLQVPQLFCDPEAELLCACLDCDFAGKRNKMVP